MNRNGPADFCEQILSTLSAKLMECYGQEFGARNLARMIQHPVGQALNREAIVTTLSQQLKSLCWNGASAWGLIT
jgi:ATP-dependent Clp protease ATP-binding subunit ClpA